MFRFTIRDVLWLTVVVVALAVGWWLDQDRIRRQTEALRVSEEKFQEAAQRLQKISLQRAQTALQAAEAELAALMEIKRRSPDALSQTELRRQELQVEVARLDVEGAQLHEDVGGQFASPNPGPNRPGIGK